MKWASVKVTKKPNLMKNIPQKMKQLELGIEDGFLTPIQNDIQNSGENVTVKRMPKYLEVADRKMKQKGVLDLKPYFSNSSKRKPTKNGGWYLIVPMRVKTKNMSNQMYYQLNKVKPSGTYINTIVEYLEATSPKRKTPEIQGTNQRVTRVKPESARNSTYVMFRTVSNKTPSSKWIINRSQINNDNFSKTTLKHIDNLAKWRAKHLFK